MQVKILEHIRTIPNYPKEGINFYDLNSLFASEVFGIVIDELARKITSDSNFSYPTHVAGVESRGFVIGSALAKELMIPFVMSVLALLLTKSNKE